MAAQPCRVVRRLAANPLLAACVLLAACGSQQRAQKVPAVSVSAGDDYSCGALNNGRVRCWGTKAVEVVGVSGATSVAASYERACAVVVDGRVSCWVSRDPSRPRGSQLRDPMSAKGVAGVADAVSVSVGSRIACALTSAGAVRCWSLSVGVDPTASETSGSSVATIPGLGRVVAMSGIPLDYACAVNAGGAVWCFYPDQFAAGVPNEATPPSKVVGIQDAVAVARGRNHACALLRNGGVRCWGDGAMGQLGNGATRDSPDPVIVEGVQNAVGIAAGGNETCVVLREGEVMCWGDDSFGVLGTGHYNGVQTPTPNPSYVRKITSAVAVTIGENAHACALLTAGAVTCWGNNVAGQLGNGATDGSAEPIAVTVI